MITPTAARGSPSLLPSRAAENLFWLGRYSERAEGIMRLVRAWQARLAEHADPAAPLVAWLSKYLLALGIDVAAPVPDALRDALGSALACASRVRDRFSIDGWAAINDLAKSAERLAGSVEPGSDAAHAMGVLLRKVSGFSGLVHENMYRFAGWRFLTLGRAIERGSTMAGLLAGLADAKAPEGTMDVAIEVGDSVMTHRRRFALETQRATVIDLLALDANNPRAILYHLTEIRDHAGALQPQYGPMTDLSRAILRAHTGLAVSTPETLDSAALYKTRDAIWGISDQLAATYWA